MKNTLLELIKRRDELFLEKFCHKGDFMSNEGRLVYVCKPIDPNEVLNFMHGFDEGILAVTDEK